MKENPILRKERIKKLCEGNIIHGLSGTPLFKCWVGIRLRCNNPKISGYKYYGARGIKVCDEWKDSPEAFVDWAIKNGYKQGLQIDRRNNDGDYTPENCRWVTNKVNQRNRRCVKFYEYEGETKALSEWVEILGLNYQRVHKRLFKYRWDFRTAVETGRYQIRRYQNILLMVLLTLFVACRVSKIDHKTGDRNPTWSKIHLDKIHKLPWHAGNDLITPGNFKPVKVVKK